jgi:hypothetical protein
MMPPMMNQMIPPPLIAPNLVPPPPPNQMIPPPPPVPPPHVGKLIIFCNTFIKIDEIRVGPKYLYSKVSSDLKDELTLRVKL